MDRDNVGKENIRHRNRTKRAEMLSEKVKKREVYGKDMNKEKCV